MASIWENRWVKVQKWRVIAEDQPFFSLGLLKMADRRDSRRHAAFGALANSVFSTAAAFFAYFLLLLVKSRNLLFHWKKFGLVPARGGQALLKELGLVSA